jgi:Flp pilus assembly pilin Flp
MMWQRLAIVASQSYVHGEIKSRFNTGNTALGSKWLIVPSHV